MAVHTTKARTYLTMGLVLFPFSLGSLLLSWWFQFITWQVVFFVLETFVLSVPFAVIITLIAMKLLGPNKKVWTNIAGVVLMLLVVLSMFGIFVWLAVYQVGVSQFSPGNNLKPLAFQIPILTGVLGLEYIITGLIYHFKVPPSAKSVQTKRISKT